MKAFRFIFLLAICCSQNIFSQNALIDSIIFFQPDSIVRIKLTNFKAGGIEKKVDTDSITSDDIVNSAMKYLGIPHCMGGNGKTTKKKDGKVCIDCSGLVYSTLADLGINPGVHSSQEMARYGKIITDTSKIQKGDILFFIKSYKSDNPEIVITHSAFALGNGQMIHASASRGIEIISINTPYWSSRFIFATRIF